VSEERDLLKRGLAFTVACVSALVILACASRLAVNHIGTLLRAPQEKEHVEALKEAVKSEANVAEALYEEQRRIADASLAREEETADLVNLLIVAVIAFVASSTWAVSLAGWRAPPLKKLADLRAESAGGSSADLGPLPAHSSEASEELDLSAVDEIVAREGTGREAAVPILNAIQATYRHLPDAAMQRVCELTEITAADLFGSASFYANYRRNPVGRHVIRVCHGTACHVSGARQIDEELRRHLAIPDDGDTDPAMNFTVTDVACVGCCSLAPVLMVGERTAGRLTPASACRAIDQGVEQAEGGRA